MGVGEGRTREPLPASARASMASPKRARLSLGASASGGRLTSPTSPNAGGFGGGTDAPNNINATAADHNHNTVYFQRHASAAATAEELDAAMALASQAGAANGAQAVRDSVAAYAAWMVAQMDAATLALEKLSRDAVSGQVCLGRGIPPRVSCTPLHRH